MPSPVVNDKLEIVTDVAPAVGQSFQVELVVKPFPARSPYNWYLTTSVSVVLITATNELVSALIYCGNASWAAAVALRVKVAAEIFGS